MSLLMKGFFSALLIICVFFAAVYSTQYFVMIMTTDWLYAYEVPLNFIHYKSIVGQDFPGAPYYFPDLLIVYLLEIFTHNLTILYFSYALIFLGAYIILVRNLFKLSHLPGNFALVGVLIAFVCSFLFFLHPYPTKALSFLNNWSGSHISVIFFGLYLIHYYIKNSQLKLLSLSALITFVLTYLIYISDNITIIQVMLPFALLVMIDFARKKIRLYTALSWLLIFFFVFVLGNETPHLFEKYLGVSFVMMDKNLFHLPTLEGISHSISNFNSVFLTSLHHIPLFYCILFTYQVLTLTGLVIIMSYHHKDKNENKGYHHLVKIVLFLYLVQLSNLFFGMVSGKIILEPLFRYLDALFILPAISLALILVYMLKEKIFLPLVSMCIIVIISAHLIMFMKDNSTLIKLFTFASRYDADVQCIDDAAEKYRLKNGVANFWAARKIRMLTKQGLMVTTLDPGLNENQVSFFKGSENVNLFYADLQKKIRFDYQFIMMNRLSEEFIRGKVGKPDQIIACPRTKLWLYTTKKSQARFNKFWHSLDIPS